jgi:uncharacterized protein (TIRG00374 family)
LEPSASSASPAGSSAQLASGLGRKIVLAVLFAALVFAGLAMYGDVQELRSTARTFAPEAFALALALAAGNYALRVVRWHYYLGQIGVRLPVAESSVVFLSGFVMSVTPGKVGEVFKSLLLYESRGTSIARTAPIIVAERLTDLIALVGLITLGSFAFEKGAVIALGSAVMVAGLILVCAYRPLGRFLLALTSRVPLLSKISPKLHEAYDALLEMTRPAPLLIGSAVAFAAWALECWSLYAVVHGFPGVHMSWDACVFAYSASTLAGAVAMMPGGLGVTEVGMTALLKTLGGAAMRPAVATAATMLVRICTLWFAVVLGAAALAVHRAMQRGPIAPSPSA